ncbi:MAG: hypothetical protein DRP16_02410, partial [Candidatus Aenigmatarchaeota archaeon]
MTEKKIIAGGGFPQAYNLLSRRRLIRHWKDALKERQSKVQLRSVSLRSLPTSFFLTNCLEGGNLRTSTL